MLLIVLSIVLIGGGAFFFAQASGFSMRGTWADFRNNEVRYAEVGPAATDDAVATTTPDMKVPILVYHIVRPSYPTDSEAVRRLAQTPEVFDAEMQYLHDAGYHVISFAALEDYLNKGTPLLVKPIIISFDDGWGDQFKYAFPILQKYGYTATFFVFTNPISTRGFMTWDDLATLRDAGMTIASHTKSHPFLTKITSPDVLWNEINGSKEVLEKKLGIQVHEFAYPFGKYNASTTADVVRAGYASARGDYVRKGTTQPLSQIYELSALNAPTTIEEFKRKF
jgi:peptidoglycan/xylan/chitin deacetylase (PgdA/CDA1 family)